MENSVVLHFNVVARGELVVVTGRDIGYRTGGMFGRQYLINLMACCITQTHNLASMFEGQRIAVVCILGDRLPAGVVNRIVGTDGRVRYSNRAHSRGGKGI